MRTPVRPRWLAISCLAAWLAPAAATQDLPLGFQATPVGETWDVPVGLHFLSYGRLLVTEKKGRLWLVVNDQVQNRVLDLSDEVLSRGDRGLLSVASDPAFAQNGYLYLLYTVDPDGDGVDDEEEAFGRLVRYTTQFDARGDLIADPLSRWVMIGNSWSDGIPSLSLTHGPGSVRFFADGSLVLSAGDGAAADHVDAGGHDPAYFGNGYFDPLEDQGAFRAQYEHSLSGKILRLDPTTALGLADNPYFTGNPADTLSKVYARGLRNPFRFSLLPVLPGAGPREDLLVSDVGWNSWEEISRVRAGDNCGWPCREGAQSMPAYLAADRWAYSGGEFLDPWLSWSHSNPGELGFTGNCATASALYTGTGYPPLYRGALFFCDYERGWLRCARLDADHQITSILGFGTNMGGLVDLAADTLTGDLVFASLSPISGQRIRRIRYLGTDQPPIAVATATPQSGGVPLRVQFGGSASTDPEGQPLHYAWDFGDGMSSTEADPSHDYLDAEVFSARLTVTDAALQSASATVLITPGNTPPQITEFLAPQEDALFDPGDWIALEAQGTDLEDEAASLPLEAVWHVNLVHDHHVHPDWIVVEGWSGAFQTEFHGDGTFYEVELVVTDSHGLSDRASVRLYHAGTRPRAEINAISDAEPRAGQEVMVRGRMLFPGPWSTDPAPSLTWDFGDGTELVFQPVVHDQEIAASHAYRRAGEYTLRLTAAAGADVHSEQLTVQVARPRPAVAIFAPLAVERWISWPDQEELANRLADHASAAGLEAAVFHYEQQLQLADWMTGFLDDSMRDIVVLIDTVPAALYAGEDDGSLVESWLENGNGVLWTGQQPFFEYVNLLGQASTAGAGTEGPGEVLDASQPGMCLGQGQQALVQPAAGRDLPSLQPFMSYKALRPDRIGSQWRVGRLYAQDAAGASDALVLRHASGGFFAQFFCTPERELPRFEVLAEFLEAYLLRPGFSPPR